MRKKLGTMKPGESGHVTRLTGDSRLRQRLIAMGVTPGAWLIVRKFAPLGDPMEINIRNYSLSIRKKDAQEIEVEIEQEEQSA